MSGFEVESQGLSSAARVTGRSGGQSGQGQKDDGVFGALMSGLATGADAGADATRGSTGRAAALLGDGAAQAEEAGAEGAQGRRPASARDLLAALFSPVRLDADVTEEGAPTPGARDGAPGGDAARPARAGGGHKPGAKVEALTGETTGATKADVKDAEAATLSAEPADGEVPAGEQAKPEADGALAARTGDVLPTLPVPAALPAPAAAEAEADLPQGGAQPGKAGADALAQTLANGDAAETGPLRVTVLAQETHFAPVRADGSPKPTFTLPGEAAGAEDAPAEADAPARRADAAPSALDRASARQASERQDARLSERREGAEAVSAEAAEATETVDAAASETGKTGSSAPAGFSPGLTLSNLRQVSSAIGAELARMAAQVPGQSPDAPRTGGGPLRLLDIQLHPADLGSVTVRMRMSDAGLEVRLSADNAETARMLRNDHAKLADMLAAEGVEEARVSVVDAADQAGAWTRFEMLPRQTNLAFAADRGEEQGTSGQERGEQGARKDDNEREASSGGDRSSRDQR